MKLFQRSSDGGKDSGVTGFFFVEIKPLFSVVLLHFRNGTREAYHSHAFNTLTLWLRGKVQEHMVTGGTQAWKAGQFKYTSRKCFHQVESLGDSWAISIRGPWVDTWQEFKRGVFQTLTYGRKVIS